MTAKRNQRPKEKLHNGKPMSHWETMARELVVDTLVRKSRMYEPVTGGISCLPHQLASQQFMALAFAIDPGMTNRSVETLDRLELGMARATAAFTKSGKIHRVTKKKGTPK